MKPLKLKSMHAHEGKCVKCENGIVKMPRNRFNMLMPDACFCIACGQIYFLQIEDLEAWEKKQSAEKAEKSQVE